MQGHKVSSPAGKRVKDSGSVHQIRSRQQQYLSRVAGATGSHRTRGAFRGACEDCVATASSLPFGAPVALSPTKHSLDVKRRPLGTVLSSRKYNSASDDDPMSHPSCRSSSFDWSPSIMQHFTAVCALALLSLPPAAAGKDGLCILYANDARSGGGAA